MYKKKPNVLKTKLGRYWRYLLLVLAVFFIISLIRNVFKILSASQRIDEAKARVEKLSGENEALKRQLALSESEAFIETQFRDRLGLSQEGEIIVVLPDAETLRKIAPVTIEEEETLPDPTWRKWLKLFL
jgi:cell division protein FtsB